MMRLTIGLSDMGTVQKRMTCPCVHGHDPVILFNPKLCTTGQLRRENEARFAGDSRTHSLSSPLSPGGGVVKPRSTTKAQHEYK
eukprot:scaffold35871_cov127-Skeletonema_marinoi.AAC.1